jgi:hypothetical protein
MAAPLYLNRHLRHLCHPQTGAPFVWSDEAGGIVCEGVVYPYEAGLICLGGEELAQISRARDDEYETRNALGTAKPRPTAEDFIRLPHGSLSGWNREDWQKAALSTAGMWEVLESQRRAAGRPPFGYQGAAAEITPDPPFIAYGLDAAGYAAYALSPYGGHYGLDMYSTGRYARLWTNWDFLPLRPGAFQVVVLRQVLDLSLERALLEGVLLQALRALAPGGVLLILDCDQAEGFRAFIEGQGGEIEVRGVAHLGEGWPAKLWGRLGRGPRPAPMIIVEL